MQHVIKRCSAVFFAGIADWSPWETETVEPAFGPYHFTKGAAASEWTVSFGVTMHQSVFNHLKEISRQLVEKQH